MPPKHTIHSHILVENYLGRLLHGLVIVGLRAKVAVQLVLLPLDAEVEGVHGLGHLLVGVLEHLDQFPRPQLVTLLEKGVRCPRPARPSCPPNPENFNIKVF